MENKRIKHIASYNQFKRWNTCPFQWWLLYPMKYAKSTFNESIELIFGNSIDYIIKEYVTHFFNVSVKSADELDLEKMLSSRMKIEYDRVTSNIREKLIQQYPTHTETMITNLLNDESESTISKADMLEYFYDGIEILKDFKNRRRKFFNRKNHELIGTEVSLEYEVFPNSGIHFKGFIDIVIRDKTDNSIILYDVKTSLYGWNKHTKKDINTTMQLLLYKILYSKLNNVDINKIHVEYLILKRKLYENVEFPQKRTVGFKPASGKVTIKKINNRYDAFINSCYSNTGEYNFSGTFPKIPIAGNCRKCPFNKNKTLCDKKI